jgi:histidinol-phosphatase (PHP family)
MHTPLCKHATGEPDAYAAQAAKRGLKGIIITCHNPMENNAYTPQVRMRDDQFDDYVALVTGAAARWAGQIDIRLGLESDYLPGQEAWLERLHQRADLHYVLGSVHPQMDEYKAVYLNGDVFAFQRTYFEHLAMAAESGLFDCLSHPDLVKNEFPAEWDTERIAPVIAHTLDRIAAAGTAMELNTSGLQKRIPEMNPGAAMLAAMHERGIPVVVGSDSHTPERVAADFEQAFDLLAAAGYTHVSMFHHRQRQDILLSAARASLQ